MWPAIAHAVDGWSALYSDSTVTRTLIGFMHIGGLLIGGGYALSEDRRILTAGRAIETVVDALPSAHGLVIGGLACVMTSGMLLFAANLEFYSRSPAFWIKMVLVSALLANGLVLKRAEAAVMRSVAAWPRLRRAAALSAMLWLVTTLAGSLLPNV